MRSQRYLALLTAALLLPACGDPTGNDETGTASAVVTDDPSAASAAPTGQAGGAEGAQASSYSGSLAADARVSIRTQAGTWIDLGSPRSVSLALQSTGDESQVHANASVPVGTYTHVRLTLADAAANINAGAVLGGVTLTGAVMIRVGGSDQSVVIEKSVEPFTINADSHARIVFDMNSEIWVNEDNAEQEQAEDEEVQQATDARRNVEREEQAS